MEPNGEIPVESVPRAFYTDFLTLAVEVEYLKAELACLKAKEERAAARKARRRRVKKKSA
jgi:hypothetical protein